MSSPPVVEAILIFGGATDPSGFSTRNDVWRLVPEGVDPATGTGYRHHFEQVIPVGGEVPSPRTRHVAAWDPTKNRLLVYGGRLDNRILLDDLWELRIR